MHSSNNFDPIIVIHPYNYTTVEKLVSGLHHITALTADAQSNLEFYAGILGLRMVKKTINFDAPDVYHLYYGDESGRPGTIMTFFPIKGLPQGRKGKGQLTVTSFSIPGDSIKYWVERLNRFHVEHKDPQTRFGDEVFMYLEDQEGLGLELVEAPGDKRTGWTGIVPADYAIKGFYGILLSGESFEKTAALLTQQMDFTWQKEQGNRIRLASVADTGGYVDIIYNTHDRTGWSGSGTVHHVAFAVKDDKAHSEVREKLVRAGMNVTPVVDRNYFHSIYFKEPGGVLFEVATSDIGFSIDEDEKELGSSLMLPAWAESNRNGIMENLGEIVLETEKFV